MLVLLDTNAYLRLAKRVRPAVGVVFGHKGYVLTVHKSVEDEVYRSARLKSLYPWFDGHEFANERLAKQIRLSTEDKASVKAAQSVLHGWVLADPDKYTSGGRSPPGSTDCWLLALGQVKPAIVVTDDLGMHALSGGFGERQVQLIRDFGARVVLMTPSYMLAIAEEFERAGIDPRETALRIGIFGAEPWTEGMRAEIERRTGIDAVDIYGLSEVMGPGVANECVETKDGLCLWEDHFYPEIIDPETGEVLPDGEEGELVITSLTKEAFPVIRYRTRDRTRLLPPSARSFRRLGRINGRTDDMLIIRGVNVFPSQIEEILLNQRAFLPNYLLEVDRAGHLDTMTVKVEWPPAGALSGVSVETAKAELAHHVKSSVGISVRVEVVEVGTLERSVGKAKRVVDRRPKG